VTTYATKNYSAKITVHYPPGSVLDLLDRKMDEAQFQMQRTVESDLFRASVLPLVFERPPWCPRWLWRWVPFRRRVLHEGKTFIDWGGMAEVVKDHWLPRLRADFQRQNAIYEILSRNNVRDRLVRQLRGWQNMSVALGPRESWRVWRTIVADHHEK
jgi:hypothetical protein